LGSALFFAVAPSSVAGLVPWWITRWEFRPPFFDLDATRAVGILLIVAGLPGLVDSFARFALQGLGTPAPIARCQSPPRTLVQQRIKRLKSSPNRSVVNHAAFLYSRSHKGNLRPQIPIQLIPNEP
jgi:hypothetical protein